MNSSYLDEHEAHLTETGNPESQRFLNLEGKPLIAPGLQRFAFESQGHRFDYNGNPRISIHLRIVGGEFDGVRLPRYYGVIIDDTGMVRIPSGQRSLLRRESVGILGQLTTDLSGMAGLPLVGRVVTVTKDGDGDPIPISLHYSKVAKLFLATPFILNSLGNQS